MFHRTFYWDLSRASLMGSLGLWVWERKNREANCHSHHIISRVHPTNIIYHCWCWPWSAGGGCVFQISPLSSCLFTPLHTALSGRKWLYSSQMNGQGVMLHLLEGGVSIYTVWNSSVWEICLFSPLINLFNHLLIPVWTHRSFFSVLGYNPVLLYLSCCSCDPLTYPFRKVGFEFNF